jgi:hypothetical protein
MIVLALFATPIFAHNEHSNHDVDYHKSHHHDSTRLNQIDNQSRQSTINRNNEQHQNHGTDEHIKTYNHN